MDDDLVTAFRERVEPEIEVMLRVALSLTHHAADAEDLVQESLLRAYRSLDRFDVRRKGSSSGVRPGDRAGP